MLKYRWTEVMNAFKCLKIFLENKLKLKKIYGYLINNISFEVGYFTKNSSCLCKYFKNVYKILPIFFVYRIFDRLQQISVWELP